MSTSAERQRRRRARLRREGMVDVSVSVPIHKRQALRNYAHQLNRSDLHALDDDRLRLILRGLKSMRTSLQKAGVQHAGVFGSVARGDNGLDSDIDVLIQIDVDQVGDILDYISICRSIQDGLGAICPGVDVDVANEDRLKAQIRAAVERDAVYAF